MAIQHSRPNYRDGVLWSMSQCVAKSFKQKTEGKDLFLFFSEICVKVKPSSPFGFLLVLQGSTSRSRHSALALLEFWVASLVSLLWRDVSKNRWVTGLCAAQWLWIPPMNTVSVLGEPTRIGKGGKRNRPEQPWRLWYPPPHLF